MERALVLARRGLGRTAPNPPVGAVAVRAGRIIGEGWHRALGAAHAEVHCIERAGGPAACRGADLYVTLEPCAHHGRTPPCTLAILAARFRRVFYAVADPNPITSGRGPRQLRRAGVEVARGLGEDAGRWLLAPYLTRVITARPLVTAKWAMTLDGRIASRTGDARWISSEAMRRRTRRERAAFDAILVGIGTVLADDPQLSSTTPRGPTPLRAVLDSTLRLPLESRLVATLERAPLVVFTAATPDVKPTATSAAKPAVASVSTSAAARGHARRRRALEERGVEVVPVPARDGRLDLLRVLEALGERGLLHLLVEGGSAVHGAFFDAGLVDRVQVIVAPCVVGGAGALGPVGGRGQAALADALRLVGPRLMRVGPDLRLEGAITDAGRGWPGSRKLRTGR